MNKHENNNKNSVRQKKSSARIVSARNKLLKIDEAIFHPKNEIVDSIRFRKRWLSNTVGNGTLCMEHVNQKLFYRVYEVASVSFDFSWVFFLPFSFSPLFSFSFFSYLFHNFHILSRFFSPSCIGSLFEFRMLFFCFLSFASSLSIYICFLHDRFYSIRSSLGIRYLFYSIYLILHYTSSVSRWLCVYSFPQGVCHQSFAILSRQMYPTTTFASSVRVLHIYKTFVSHNVQHSQSCRFPSLYHCLPLSLSPNRSEQNTKSFAPFFVGL